MLDLVMEKFFTKIIYTCLNFYDFCQTLVYDFEKFWPLRDVKAALKRKRTQELYALK